MAQIQELELKTGSHAESNTDKGLKQARTESPSKLNKAGFMYDIDTTGMSQTEINRARRHAARDKKREQKLDIEGNTVPSKKPKEVMVKPGPVNQKGNDSDLSFEEQQERQHSKVIKKVCIFNPEKYKTIPCTVWKKNQGSCPREHECWFVHGKDEQRSYGEHIDEYLEDHRIRNPTVIYWIPTK